MKRPLLLLLFLTVILGFSSPAFAQNGSITGKVVDAVTQSPLPGVNVVIAGTLQGAATDVDGNYTIPNVKPGTYTMRATYIGYRTQEITEIPVAQGKATTLNFTLEEDVAGLEEVVIVGYAVQQKVNLTGAVNAITGADIAKQPVMRPSIALQGQVPGVTVTRGSGQPGSDGGTIRIRGIGTLSDSNPLVLIDGVESTIDAIDPNSIESMSVLKDAASASIYGSRAANGVILVTTKRGRSDRLTVNYRNFVGYQAPTRLPEFVDGATFMTYLNEANRNEGKKEPFTQEYIEAWKANNATQPDQYPNTDWQEVVMKDRALQQQHDLSVSGGVGNLRVRASAHYMDQEGIIANTNYDRYGFRFNSDLKVSKSLDLAFDLSGRRSSQTQPAPGMWRVFYEMNRCPNIYAARWSDGLYGPGWNGQNSLAMAESGGTNETTWNEAAVQMRAVYRPFSGANIDVSFTPVYSSNLGRNFNRKYDTYDFNTKRVEYSWPQKSSLSVNNSQSLNTTLNVVGNYAVDLKKTHHIATMIGMQQITNRNDWFNAYRDAYTLPDYQQLNSGSIENMQNSGSATEWGLLSFFGRLNYNYGDRYLLEGNLRYDGSSRFAEGNRFGVFPSFSAGWRVSKEAFFKPVTFVDELKFRASWGRLGNQNIGLYPYFSTIALGQNFIFNGVPVDGAALLAMANRGISWEETEMSNFGVDLSVLKYRLEFTGDFYIKNTDDILLRLPIPATVGLTAPYQNAGRVRNIGYDLSLNYKDRIGDLRYSAGITFSDVRNEVMDLKDTGPYNSGFTTIREGESMNSMFGYESEGLFQTQEEITSHAKQFGTVAPGDIKYKDQLTVDTDGDGVPDAGDGIINADDRVVLGNTIPRYTYGLNLTASFKGFDASAFFQGVGKVYGYMNNEAGWAFYNGGKLQTWQLDHWTPDNPDAVYPRYTFNLPNNQQTSDYWMRDASYLRLKNVTFGYTIPAKVFPKTLSVSALRLYFSGQDLFSRDNYRGYDPEAGLGDGNFYPFVSSYTFGIEATF